MKNKTLEYPEITELVISNFKSIIYDYCMSDSLRESLIKIIDKLIELYGKENVVKLIIIDSDEEVNEIDVDEEFNEIDSDEIDRLKEIFG